MSAATDNQARELAALPATFTYAQARAHGLSKRALYGARDRGLVEVIARGLYRQTTAPLADVDLIAVALRSPRATLCLTTALAHHDLTDAIPRAIDVAIPRGTRAPSAPFPVAWHRFEVATFDIGREALVLDADTTIGIYSPERCIIDAFRLRRTQGHDLGYEALRRWRRQRGSHPATLLELARHWPRVRNPLLRAFEVLG